ncbi:MAG: hypothetical protein WBZ50_03520, partial [Nitrososphaeraceae archaeon]
LYDSATNPQKKYVYVYFLSVQSSNRQSPAWIGIFCHTVRATRFGVCDSSYIDCLSNLSHVFDM